MITTPQPCGMFKEEMTRVLYLISREISYCSKAIEETFYQGRLPFLEYKVVYRRSYVKEEESWVARGLGKSISSTITY